MKFFYEPCQSYFLSSVSQTHIFHRGGSVIHLFHQFTLFFWVGNDWQRNTIPRQGLNLFQDWTAFHFVQVMWRLFIQITLITSILCEYLYQSINYKSGLFDYLVSKMKKAYFIGTENYILRTYSVFRIVRPCKFFAKITTQITQLMPSIGFLSTQIGDFAMFVYKQNISCYVSKTTAYNLQILVYTWQCVKK